MKNTYAKPEWFNGNQDAMDIYNMFVELSHTWDDLIDKDKDVTAEQIHQAFLICLVYLPSNPLYKQLESLFAPMWSFVVSAYKVANKFEQDKDEKGLEISHGLRYAAGHVVYHLVSYCVGPKRAEEVMPDVWKSIFYERFEDYRREHINAE